MTFEPRAATDLRHLRILLRNSGYATGRLRALVAIDDTDEEILSNTGRYSFYYLDPLTESHDPAAVLLEMFLLGGVVPLRRLDLLDPGLVTLLWELRLIERVEDAPERVRGKVTISEYQGCYFLSDRLFENSATGFVVESVEDECMPLHASSIELRRSLAALPGPGSSFLDMGCGTGCQSILAAAGHHRLVGVDLSARAVGYATANATLNGVDARFLVGDCGTYTDSERYGLVAFNSPDSATAFQFINTRLHDLLDAGGTAQIWAVCEVPAADGTLDGVLNRQIHDRGRWLIETSTSDSSPFALNADMVRARRLPWNSLLVDGPQERDAYFDGLARREIVEVLSVVLKLRRRADG